jgi:hypothetical protein
MRPTEVITMKPTVLLMTALLLAACGDVADGEGSDTTTADQSTTTSGRQVTPSTIPPFEPSVGSVPDEKLDPLVADAADRASVSAESVVVLRSQQVVWSSPALDCPEPGVSYTQVLTNGYWVVLQAGDAEYDYRAEIEGDFRLCVGGAPPSDVLVDR